MIILIIYYNEYIIINMKTKSVEQAQLDMMQTTKKAFIKHAAVLQKSITDETKRKQQELEDEKIMKLSPNPLTREVLVTTFRGLNQDMKYKYIFEICSDNKLLHHQNKILTKRNLKNKEDIKDLEDTNSHLNEMFDNITEDENETKKKTDTRILSLRDKCKQKNKKISQLQTYLTYSWIAFVVCGAMVAYIH